MASNFEGVWGPVGADCEPLQNFLIALGVPEQIIEICNTLEHEISLDDDSFTISIAPPAPEEADNLPPCVEGPDMSIKYVVTIGKETQEKDPKGNVYKVSGKLESKDGNNIFTVTKKCASKNTVETQVHEVKDDAIMMKITMSLKDNKKGKEFKGVHVCQKKMTDQQQAGVSLLKGKKPR